MAKLILVHEFPKGQEILLNADQIEIARTLETQSGTRSEIRMTNEKLHHVRETLDDLIGLCVGH
jgi:hypothetical protein